MLSEYKAIKALEKQTGKTFQEVSIEVIGELTLQGIENYLKQTDNRYLYITQGKQIVGLIAIDVRIDAEALKALKALKLLVLSNNEISDISILQTLTNLTSLYLSNNKISDISALQTLTNLTSLNLRNNKIKTFPKELLDLHLEVEIKENYGSGLLLKDNPIESPPLEVMAQGNKAIAQYFADLKAQGRGKLDEAKLIIVGEPNAGKSTLMECLLDPDYVLEPNKTSTMGIDVRAWEFTHGRKMRANIWDFGGQEIQYMTHQFFLTPGSLYVLLATNERNDDAKFPYWFKIIDLLGKEKERYSPVLVVKNRRSDKAHQSFHFNFDETEYRKAYKHLHIEVLEVDLNNRKGDFQALQEKIMEMISKLPIVNDDRPAMWSPIRQAMRDEKRDYIHRPRYDAICNQHGVSAPQSQEILSRSLHHTGSILHFIDDTQLADFIILNPQWAVDALYGVLQYAKIESQHGCFEEKNLATIWKKYSSNERANLLTLMKKDNFEICYPLPNDEKIFIAPQFLPRGLPSYDFDIHEALKFQFQYRFMPYGIINRLIVRLSAYIHEERVTQRGVILRKEGCMAQIIQNENRTDGLKVIEIAVWGDAHRRKYFLHEIRNEVDEIHKKWFKYIAVDAMIPCSCSECMDADEPHFFRYKMLQRFQERSKPTAQCQKSGDDVAIQSLLEGVLIMDDKKERTNIINNNLTIKGDNYGIAGAGDGNAMQQEQLNPYLLFSLLCNLFYNFPVTTF